MPLHLILTGSILIPVLVGLVNYRSLPKWAKIIVITLFLGAITEVVARSMAVTFGTNVAVYYAYIMALFICFGFFFSNFTHTLRFISFGAIIPAIEFVSLPLAFPSFSFFALDVVILLACAHTLKRIATNEMSEHALSLVSTVFMYFLCSLVYLTYHRFSSNPDLLDYVATLWSAVNVLCNLTFALALWKSRFSSLSL